MRSAAPAAVGGADLVIGIGNPLRGDDGVGWWLAQRAERAGSLVRLVPQLTPELALEVAAARRVLFVDACCAAGRAAAPQLRRLWPGGAAHGVAGGHQLEPAEVLALATLFREDPPPAWLLLLPAYAFPHDTALSAAARRRLPQAQLLLRRWLVAQAPWAQLPG